MSFHDGMTLAEARNELRELVMEAGHKCPCCTQLAKVYRRKIHATMARSLILMWRAAGTDWVHVPTVAGDACEAGKLRYWGLVEEEKATRPDGGRTGWWRVTDKGAAWIGDRTRVPKYAHIYDGRCLRVAGDPISITDALGDRFDYGELMGAVPQGVAA